MKGPKSSSFLTLIGWAGERTRLNILSYVLGFLKSGSHLSWEQNTHFITFQHFEAQYVVHLSYAVRFWWLESPIKWYSLHFLLLSRSIDSSTAKLCLFSSGGTRRWLQSLHGAILDRWRFVQRSKVLGPKQVEPGLLWSINPYTKTGQQLPWDIEHDLCVLETGQSSF